ncbi:MAG: CRISPR-associated endoribonuclease Cas6 [Candidatus Woesearchaeota archaeon]
MEHTLDTGHFQVRFINNIIIFKSLMRLILKLKSRKDSIYDTKYYHKLRGFIYNLLKNSIFDIHDKRKYKFFCFSNIFPIEEIKTDKIRNLLISSPNKDFIYWLKGKISEEKIIEIGEMQFELVDLKIINQELYNRLITGTPIVVRIPKNRYKEYNIISNRPYEYWKTEYETKPFIKQLTENLIKKYNLYYNKEMDYTKIFEFFNFKKEVCVHVIENGKEHPVVGTLWEFEFSHLNDIQRKILEFGIETGFGELNSSGFGFINPIKK